MDKLYKMSFHQSFFMSVKWPFLIKLVVCTRLYFRAITPSSRTGFISCSSSTLTKSFGIVFSWNTNFWILLLTVHCSLSLNYSLKLLNHCHGHVHRHGFVNELVSLNIKALHYVETWHSCLKREEQKHRKSLWSLRTGLSVIHLEKYRVSSSIALKNSFPFLCAPPQTPPPSVMLKCNLQCNKLKNYFGNTNQKNRTMQVVK